MRSTPDTLVPVRGGSFGAVIGTGVVAPIRPPLRLGCGVAAGLVAFGFITLKVARLAIIANGAAIAVPISLVRRFASTVMTVKLFLVQALANAQSLSVATWPLVVRPGYLNLTAQWM